MTAYWKDTGRHRWQACWLLVDTWVHKSSERSSEAPDASGKLLRVQSSRAPLDSLSFSAPSSQISDGASDKLSDNVIESGDFRGMQRGLRCARCRFIGSWTSSRHGSCLWFRDRSWHGLCWFCDLPHLMSLNILLLYHSQILFLQKCWLM